MAKETPEEKADREQKEQEAANLANATPPTADSTSDAVSAGNVAASEAAGKVSTAAAAAAGPENSTPNPDKTRPGDRTAAAQTTPNVKPSKKFDLVDKFLELSGYKAGDVIGHSDERRTVVTSNGGKYEVSKKGTKLRKLAGPDTPASLAAVEEEDDD